MLIQQMGAHPVSRFRQSRRGTFSVRKLHPRNPWHASSGQSSQKSSQKSSRQRHAPDCRSPTDSNPFTAVKRQKRGPQQRAMGATGGIGQTATPPGAEGNKRIGFAPVFLWTQQLASKPQLKSQNAQSFALSPNRSLFPGEYEDRRAAVPTPCNRRKFLSFPERSAPVPAFPNDHKNDGLGRN